jgi:hypothetical protein
MGLGGRRVKQIVRRSKGGVVSRKKEPKLFCRRVHPFRERNVLWSHEVFFKTKILC